MYSKSIMNKIDEMIRPSGLITGIDLYGTVKFNINLDIICVEILFLISFPNLISDSTLD